MRLRLTFLATLVGVAVATSMLLTIPAHLQMLDTCQDGSIKVIDVTNKRERCMAGNGTQLVYRATGLNINQTNTDIGSFTNLPTRYLVNALYFENASATPTLSTVSLRTATGGGGTAIVNAQALSSLTGSTVLLNATLAVNAVQTSSTLTLRAVAAAGGAATADATLIVTPLN